MILSFVITASTSLLLSAIVVSYHVRGRSDVRVLRNILLSLSDQQIIIALAFQTVGLIRMWAMVHYHFFTLWMLSLLSTVTHLSMLLALVDDYKRDLVMRWIRSSLIFANVALSTTCGVLIVIAEMRNLRLTLPIGCTLQPPPYARSFNVGTSGVVIIVVMTAHWLSFGLGTWALLNRRLKCLKRVQVIGLLVLVAIGIWSAVQLIKSSKAFGTGPPSVYFLDGSEGRWSFGQALPFMLYLQPVISAIEITRVTKSKEA